MYLQEILCKDADNLLTVVCQVGAVGLPVRMALSVDVRQGAPGSCPECPGCDWQKGCWSALTEAKRVGALYYITFIPAPGGVAAKRIPGKKEVIKRYSAASEFTRAKGGTRDHL